MVIEERTEKAPAVPTTLNVWRCWNCSRVVARLFLVPGCVVEIRCKCGATNTAALVEKQTA